MNEPQLGSSPEGTQGPEPTEAAERPDFSRLSFAELVAAEREIATLARRTFQETEYGFHNAVGDGITIRQREGIWRVFDITDEPTAFHLYITSHPDSVM